MPTDLLRQLVPDGADHSEVLQIIDSYFLSARSTLTGEVEYPNSDNYALRMRHKHGRIATITPGPGLTADMVQTLGDKIRLEVIESQGTSLQRCIVFSSAPVKGF